MLRGLNQRTGGAHRPVEASRHPLGSSAPLHASPTHLCTERRLPIILPPLPPLLLLRAAPPHPLLLLLMVLMLLLLLAPAPPFGPL